MNSLYTLTLVAIFSTATAAATTHQRTLLDTSPISLPLSTTTTAKKAPAGAETAKPHDWQKLGIGKYTDDLLTTFFEGQPSTYYVEVEKDAANEGYYRIVEPIRSNPDIAYYGNYITNDESIRYMVIDATNPEKVIIEPSDLGIVINNEEHYMYSYTWLAKTGVIDESVISSYGFNGLLEDNVISFSTPISLWVTNSSLDPQGKGYPGNTNGAWRLALPGAKDYSIDLLGGSWCPTDGKALVSAWAGADVADIVAGAVTDMTDEAQLAAILTDPTHLTSQQGALIDLPTNLKPCQPVYIVAYTLDSDGKTQECDYTIVYAPDATTGWKDLPGKARFYDYTVTHAYNFTPHEIEVDVQEDESTPGRYRIVNPFANTESNTLTPSVHGHHDHYMYFDASDPNCVIVEEGPVGYITETDGDFRISSRAAQMLAQGSTKAQIKDLSYGGILKDNRITFPFVAYLYAGFLIEGPDYWMNVNFTDLNGSYTSGPMYLDLTDVLGVSDLNADCSDDPAVYYNLQGLPITSPEPGQLVIRRTATSTTKLIYQ